MQLLVLNLRYGAFYNGVLVCPTNVTNRTSVRELRVRFSQKLTIISLAIPNQQLTQPTASPSTSRKLHA